MTYIAYCNRYGCPFRARTAHTSDERYCSYCGNKLYVERES